MNKIIVAFDPLRYSETTALYAAGLAKHNHAHLVGVFLEDYTYHSYSMYQLVDKESLSSAEENVLAIRDTAAREKSVEHFKELCVTNGIEYSAHHDRNIAIRELILESLYADLLILNSEETVIHYSENPPTNFVRALLADAQCPVHVLPASPKPVESLVFLYDGSSSSVHAIRNFYQLVPSLVDLPIDVVTVNKPQSNLSQKLLSEMLKDHFKDVRFTHLNGNPETEIVDYLQNKHETTLVILGAYRRSSLSRWYRHSMADALMEKLRLSLFIAHN